ncbi:hypothetical protein K08M3_09090 [Vibrio alginolyticus]|jgi:hypothetical protein|uniref:Uncharacterized protein n=3 Tax=Vibrio alginolyticus TaxID=663 RepID=A0A1W6W432_VIBAL|nr:hypothetical protein K01M1_09300 [Vibrio alginolyticus]GAD71515.1 hypothetical protein VAL01S_09_00270 [Vibrio alginolyticus NBRC 15630 = ATCC 17749]ARP02600.1 hypothetical protein K04M1_09410 [Vibrio alginolyticus]ARP07633.1 hypothetical protein K04M3_09080 [Vibrio alginolyticus]ARP12720.1 hypothetical protein K04M5_09090 [Vibrio alginolyticus]
MVVIDMNEKVRIPIVTDTVLVDGCYQEERRFGEERRKNKKRWRHYERRINSDPRKTCYKSIDEEV